MTQNTISYLQRYVEQLEAVETPAQLYGGLMDWQFSELDQGAHAHRVLTNALQKVQPGVGPATTPVGITADAHPPTTAVGYLENVVLIAANPYFNPGKNRNGWEAKTRLQGAEHNKAFCRDLFELHGGYVQEVGWWMQALAFAHQVVTGTAPNDHGGLVEWAVANRAVGGVDLVPFHSSEDYFTPALVATNPRGNVELRLELKGSAMATLRMAVLRLRPKMVFVSSLPGAMLVSEFARALVDQGKAEAGGAVTVNLRENLTEKQRVRLAKYVTKAQYWTVSHQDGSSTLLVTFPNQIFSGRAALQNMRGEMAMALHGLLTR